MKQTLLSLVLIYCICAICFGDIVQETPQEKNDKEIKINKIEYQIWKERYDKFKSQKSTGNNLTILGFASTGLGVGLMVVGSQREEVSLFGISVEYYPHRNLFWLGLATAMFGTAAGSWGLTKRSEAKGEIEKLEEEARVKGFLYVGLSQYGDGFSVSYKINF